MNQEAAEAFWAAHPALKAAAKQIGYDNNLIDVDHPEEQVLLEMATVASSFPADNVNYAEFYCSRLSEKEMFNLCVDPEQFARTVGNIPPTVDELLNAMFEGVDDAGNG
jgi:hypothetical protein